MALKHKESSSGLQSSGTSKSAIPSSDLAVIAVPTTVVSPTQLTPHEPSLSNLVVQECLTTPLVPPAVQSVLPAIQPSISPHVVARISQTPVQVKRKKLRFVPASSVEVHRCTLYRAKNIEKPSCVAAITTQGDSCVMAQKAEPVRVVGADISGVVSDDEDVLLAIFDEGLSAEEWNKMRRERREEKARRLRGAAVVTAMDSGPAVLSPQINLVPETVSNDPAGPSDQYNCPDCSRGFQTKAGLSLHQRRAHTESYFQRLTNERVVKEARWDPEFEYLVAVEEISLRKEGLVDDLDGRLAKRFPTRTREAIRGHRKSVKYKELVDRLSSEASRDVEECGSSCYRCCCGRGCGCFWRGERGAIVFGKDSGVFDVDDGQGYFEESGGGYIGQCNLFVARCSARLAASACFSVSLGA